MNVQILPMVRRFATPAELADAELRRGQERYERQLRADRQARAHEVMTSSEALWHVLRRLDDEDGIALTTSLLAALKSLDVTEIALKLNEVVQQEAAECIP